MTTFRRKLIEVALPLAAISTASAIEKAVPRRGHPQGIHLWWARRPLAACRAVLFAQLVDDPSAWPDRFPTEADQDRERQRLFRLIERLVPWESCNDPAMLGEVRLEIARSFARGRVADGEGDARDQAVLGDGPKSNRVLAYLAEVVPPVHDPFAGGASIPLEAQRLGLRAIATDLNPVAVLISKALIEIPPRFAGRVPVGPLPAGERQGSIPTHWPGATGLAEDVRRYGQWIRSEAHRRIGHLYPDVPLPTEHGGGRATPVGWLWARTVESPNPAFRNLLVPLAASFWLSKKEGKKTWLEAEFADDRKSYRFIVRTGGDGPVIEETVNRTGATCLASGQPIPFTYIRDAAKAGRMGARLMAIAVDGRRSRTYLAPDDAAEAAAGQAVPPWIPDTALPNKALGFRIQQYGMSHHRDLFTPRQAAALGTFTELIDEVRALARNAAMAAGMADDERHLDQGGDGATAWADAVATYLALVIGKTADYNSTIATWNIIGGSIRSTFARHALQMTWDYYETNPLADTTGSWSSSLKWVVDALAACPTSVPARAHQADAASGPADEHRIVCTDPPYYDNIGYSDLSDFFYVWLRRAVRNAGYEAFNTVLVPKSAELVANQYRHGSTGAAEAFFLSGMSKAVGAMNRASAPSFPVCIYYAFKQSETGEAGTSSTGWETFLGAVVQAGFNVVGTWPVRTERDSRNIGIGKNALASSVVLVCRKRADDAPTVTRGKFRQLLRTELPEALRALEKGNVAPVDMAQASIGPGMAVFSRHSRVLEADDKPMTVRTALQLIHEVADELRGEEEAELDRETRFAVTWFETRAFDEGPYGEAEVLATARAVSVEGVKETGIVKSAAGKVRLLRRAELPAGWDPAKDARATVWEATQHLIKRLDDAGEGAAADLLARLGPVADDARLLAYRLYTVCERKGWADEGRAYNGLVIAWPDLEKMAANATPAASNQPAQQRLI